MIVNPGNDGIRYISFTQYDTILKAKEGLQLPDFPTWHGSFNTLQIIDDLRIPYAKRITWRSGSGLGRLPAVTSKSGTGLRGKSMIRIRG